MINYIKDNFQCGIYTIIRWLNVVLLVNRPPDPQICFLSSDERIEYNGSFLTFPKP